MDDASGDKCLIITAYKNTWLQRREDESDKSQEEENGQAVGNKNGGQRKKRGRRGKGKNGQNKTAGQPSPGLDSSNLLTADCPSETEPLEKRSRIENTQSLESPNLSNPDEKSFVAEAGKNEDTNENQSVSAVELNEEPNSDQLIIESEKIEELSAHQLVNEAEKNNDDTTPPAEPIPDYLVKARVLACIISGVLTVEMNWIDGSKYKEMNHIFQFIRNNLKYT